MLRVTTLNVDGLLKSRATKKVTIGGISGKVSRKKKGESEFFKQFLNCPIYSVFPN